MQDEGLLYVVCGDNLDTAGMELNIYDTNRTHTYYKTMSEAKKAAKPLIGKYDHIYIREAEYNEEEQTYYEANEIAYSIASSKVDLFGTVDGKPWACTAVVPAQLILLHRMQRRKDKITDVVPINGIPSWLAECDEMLGSHYVEMAKKHDVETRYDHGRL